MPRGDVVLLDFEGVYFFQPELLQKATHIDLRHLKSVKYMCDESTLERVAENMKCRAFISFLGDSAYHHFSYIFLTQIDTNFELVVLDNHRDDMKKTSPLITCDNWIRKAKRLENLEAVHIVRKMDQLPRHFEHPIYLSIDKDVLSDRFLKLGWDQGTMTLDELFEAVEFLCENFTVVGVDISGEPRDLFEMERGEQINLRLLDIVLRYAKRPSGLSLFRLSPR
ncbi:hypothetical protein [Thermotoga caldifontis]|uniref:hypothetical protein n=1 Tax=Thermotoga caldifontis TaxID=1508419 RepID=UPI00059717DE|nr:hypothetical protein [Thermotoga caldifontis]